jgi:transcription antitermination factor NusB
MRKRTIARECVLKILYQLEILNEPLSEILSVFWENNTLSSEIREFAEIIVRGVEQHSKAIDEKIVKYTENWELNRMAVVDRNILRFAVYELLYLSDVPPKVTINEAVNIAKKYSQEDAGKFVNGVLDKINHSEAPISGKADSGQ